MINDRTLFQGASFTKESPLFQNDNSVNTNDMEATSKVVESTSAYVEVSSQVVEQMLTSRAEYEDEQESLLYLNDITTENMNQLTKESCLAPNSEQSKPVSMILINSLGNSSAEDVEMNSNCLQESSIVKRNMIDLLPNDNQSTPDSFIDEEVLQQSNVAYNEQELLLQCDVSVSRAENSFEDETMLRDSQDRSEESGEELVDDTVRYFDSFVSFDDEQKSSIYVAHINTPIPRCLSEIETLSEDERDVEVG